MAYVAFGKNVRLVQKVLVRQNATMLGIFLTMYLVIKFGNILPLTLFLVKFHKMWNIYWQNVPFNL